MDKVADTVMEYADTQTVLISGLVVSLSLLVTYCLHQFNKTRKIRGKIFNSSRLFKEAVYKDMQRVLISGLVVSLSLFFPYCLHQLNKTRKIRGKISKKQAECRAAIAELEERLATNGIPKKRAQEILKLSFNDLQAGLQSGRISAQEALKAYQAKALEVNTTLNCIVEPVKEAEKEAKERDGSCKKGPLHGVPVSVKENYYLKGYHSTGGMSLFLKEKAQEDGNIIKVLRHQGAVPFVRTNIPQGMMTFECSNPIYGTTCNPHNLKRGPGGSSGGEGAILGGEGSILGWGTDIGGSVRIPAHFCGICTLKPTTGRISCSSKTCEELIYGQTLIQPTCGPMARDVDTVVEAMKAMLCQYHFDLDPEMPPIPFRKEIYESKQPLKIGFYKFDGTTRCIPGVERAIDEAAEALTKMGHTVVEFAPPRVDEVFTDIIIPILFGDGGKNFLYQMGEDLTDDSLKMIVLPYKLPRFMQTILSYLASFIAREDLPRRIMKSLGGVEKTYDWWKMAQTLDDYKKEFMGCWKADKLDAVICPVLPYVAVPTGEVKHLLGGAAYSTLYNALNYPAGVVPVTKVTAVDQKNMQDYPSKKGSEKAIIQMFSADTGGLPVGVQCVGLPFQEELVLRVMKDIETGLTKKSHYNLRGEQ